MRSWPGRYEPSYLMLTEDWVVLGFEVGEAASWQGGAVLGRS